MFSEQTWDGRGTNVERRGENRRFFFVVCCISKVGVFAIIIFLVYLKCKWEAQAGSSMDGRTVGEASVDLRWLSLLPF